MGQERFLKLMALLAVFIVGMMPSPGLCVDTPVGPGGNGTAYSLTVTTEGAGEVTSIPRGIDCGATCTHSFPAGRRVFLNPEPDAESYFAGWSGACSGVKPCIVPMTKDQTITATFKTGPRIVVEPTKVDFGKTKINHAKHEHVMILNRGKQNLTVGAIFLDGPDTSEYMLVHNECSGRTIRPHHGCHFTVAFHPTVAGTFYALVEIPSDDPETPQVTVPLSGSAGNGGEPNPLPPI